MASASPVSPLLPTENERPFSPPPQQPSRPQSPQIVGGQSTRPQNAPQTNGQPNRSQNAHATNGQAGGLFAAAQKTGVKPKAAAHFEGAISDIALATCLVVVPMLTLSAVFIGLVFHWRVDLPSNGSVDPLFTHSVGLINSTSSTDAAYYVSIDSARLVTIASWTSTAISFLPPWVMILYSYPLAARYKQSKTADLPTPFQLWMIVALLTGSLGSVWDWVVYRAKRPVRKRANVLVTLTAIMLLGCLLLGLLVLLADTWLHLTTTTVLLQTTLPSDKSLSTFSRALSPSCLNPEWNSSCTVIKPDREYGDGLVYRAPEAYRTLYDNSKENMVLSASAGGQQYSYIAATNVAANTSYRASTFAVNTQCSAITKACGLATTEVCRVSVCPSVGNRALGLSYSCSSALAGEMTTYYYEDGNKPLLESSGDTNLFVSYFGDVGLQEYHDLLNDPLASAADTYFTQFVPSHFAVGAKVAMDSTLRSNDNTITYGQTDIAGLILQCSSQLLSFEYSYSDGTASDIVVSPADNDTILAITNPWLIPGSQALDSLVVGMRQAGLEETMDDLTASFAQTYSHAMLSMGVGAVVPAPSIRESVRHLQEITRMPKAPFFTLICLNCLYALMGMVLAGIALVSRPRAIKPYQARLSGPGLVASLFEGERAERNVTSMSQLFEENSHGITSGLGRVSLLPTDQGGLKYNKL